jgi:hypothetical protein
MVFYILKQAEAEKYDGSHSVLHEKRRHLRSRDADEPRRKIVAEKNGLYYISDDQWKLFTVKSDMILTQYKK